MFSEKAYSILFRSQDYITPRRRGIESGLFRENVFFSKGGHISLLFERDEMSYTPLHFYDPSHLSTPEYYTLPALYPSLQQLYNIYTK